MTARLLFQPSTFTTFRFGMLGIAAFVGMWDVERLLTAGGQSVGTIDLLTCPIVPVMRLVAAYVNVSDTALVWILFCGNAAIYGLVGYFLARWFEQRVSRPQLQI